MNLEEIKRKRHHLLRGVAAWVRGWYYKLKFRLLLKKIRIGRRFRVYGKIYVVGPGRVEIGNGVIFQGEYIKPICISTQRPDSSVRIGHHVGINGTTIQCTRSITIDDDCAIAAQYITDSQNHALAADRRRIGDRGVAVEPVHLRRNVWVSVSVVILHGVTVGENSVIGACSLVREPVPANVLATGNPLRILRDIEPTTQPPAEVEIIQSQTVV